MKLCLAGIIVLRLLVWFDSGTGTVYYVLYLCTSLISPGLPNSEVKRGKTLKEKLMAIVSSNKNPDGYTSEGDAITSSKVGLPLPCFIRDKSCNFVLGTGIVSQCSHESNPSCNVSITLQ